MAWYSVVRSSLTYTLTDLRVPDLGWNQKLMSSSCQIHVLRAKDGYASCRSGYYRRFMDGKNRTTPDHGITDDAARSLPSTNRWASSGR